jgi:hypothetical protein
MRKLREEQLREDIDNPSLLLLSHRFSDSLDAKGKG